MKKTVVISVVFVITAVFLFLSGYRLSAEGAAWANINVSGDSELILCTETSIGETFVFKVNDYHVMTTPQRKGLLWLANAACTTAFLDDKADPVRTLGWYGVSGETPDGTVWIIQSKDTRVAAIKVDSKLANFDESGIAILDWNTPLKHMPSDVSAIDSDGNKLYVYDDNDGLANTTDLTKMKWYPWNKA